MEKGLGQEGHQVINDHLIRCPLCGFGALFVLGMTLHMREVHAIKWIPVE